MAFLYLKYVHEYPKWPQPPCPFLTLWYFRVQDMKNIQSVGLMMWPSWPHPFFLHSRWRWESTPQKHQPHDLLQPPWYLLLCKQKTPPAGWLPLYTSHSAMGFKRWSGFYWPLLVIRCNNTETMYYDKNNNMKLFYGCSIHTRSML